MDDAAVRATCELFDLGLPLGEPAPVAGGLTNRMWRLETERGVFAVKEMNRDFGRTDYVAWFDRAFTLEQAAFVAGVPMPRPVPVATTGRCLGELTGTGDRPTTVRVHEWVEGEKLENGTVYPAEVSGRVAAMLARIHGLGMRAEPELDEALRAFGNEHWRSRAEQAERAGAEWAAEFQQALPALAELEEYLAAVPGDPTPDLLSHRDSDMKNVLRTRAGELLLVDWDAAGRVNPRHDLANHALVWAGLHLGEPDAGIARAFVDAYRRAGGAAEPFRPTDLAELVSLRLGWLDFNLRRALGERARDEADRQAGVNVIRRNVTELPRWAGSLPRWLAVLGD